MARIREASKYQLEHIASQAINKADAKKMSVSSWTFYYHKPYQTDWKEAKYKARGKKWKGLL